MNYLECKDYFEKMIGEELENCYYDGYSWFELDINEDLRLRIEGFDEIEDIDNINISDLSVCIFDINKDDIIVMINL